ncbi:hypothetical protein PDIDSM_7321 [Penicillium digitatum]|nr:hypothetical protein PDIDSM_7321 [Penicillium digitatum]
MNLYDPEATISGIFRGQQNDAFECLANDITTGLITGDMLVDSRKRDEWQTGYVQQQDIHLHTSTGREALVLGILLRHTPNYTIKENKSRILLWAGKPVLTPL